MLYRSSIITLISAIVFIIKDSLRNFYFANFYQLPVGTLQPFQQQSSILFLHQLINTPKQQL